MIRGEQVSKNHEMIDPEILNHQVLEGIADWVRVVDSTGIIIYANKAMKKDLGDNIVGISCNKAHCQLERCEFCITERSIATGKVYQKEEYINGNYYSIKSSPVRDENKDIFAAVEVFRNVTRERRLELELINKNKKMSKDLRFAKKIQGKMLPEKGSKNGIKLDYIYKASEMLSGDMFDIFTIDKDNVGIYISDVAGNGVSASMMTMFVRQTMRGMEEDLINPALTLKDLHRRFLSLNLEVENYFTIFYGVYNKTSGKFRYANAGHNCMPIKFNDSDKDVNILEIKGFPINSLIKEVDYKEEEVTLKKGDKVLFYTDGVTEARNTIGKEFGINGVVDIVEKRPENILKSIDMEVLSYSWGEQEDDFAIVLFEIEK